MSLQTLLFLPLGLLLGGWHFGSLRWFSRQLVEAPQGPRWGRLLGLHLLRLCVLVLACWGSVRQGAGPLLALTGGLLVARLLVQRLDRQARPDTEDRA